MFRFEVHLRITDDTGEHIQHMTNAHGDSEGFLLSSLFDNNKNVVVAGPSHLSRFNKDHLNLNSHSRSVLSSFVNDDICYSLVDNIVSCATECLNDNEDSCVGEQFGWKHRFDWNFHTGLDKVNEENVQSVYGKEVQKQNDCCTDLDFNLSKIKCKIQNSDSEFSWGSSDSSSIDREQEDNDGLWDLLRCTSDPYHPLHFTACMSSAVANRQRTQSGQQRKEFTSTPSSVSCCSDSSEQGNRETVNSEDEEEALWKSLSWDDDPYHPLNFRAPLNSAYAFTDSHGKSPKTPRNPISNTGPKPFLMQRQVISHQWPQLCVEKPAKVPWKRPITKTVKANMTKKNSTIKKVIIIIIIVI